MSEYTQPELPGMGSIDRTSMGSAAVDIDLDGVGFDLVREINRATSAISQWEERKKAAHDQLLKLLTGGVDREGVYGGRWNGVRVTQVAVYTERRFNTLAFQSDHPALYESYRQEALRKRLTTDKSF